MMFNVDEIEPALASTIAVEANKTTEVIVSMLTMPLVKSVVAWPKGKPPTTIATAPPTKPATRIWALKGGRIKTNTTSSGSTIKRLCKNSDMENTT
jgi:hypothetical protein